MSGQQLPGLDLDPSGGNPLHRCRRSRDSHSSRIAPELFLVCLLGCYGLAEPGAESITAVMFPTQCREIKFRNSMR